MRVVLPYPVYLAETVRAKARNRYARAPASGFQPLPERLTRDVRLRVARRWENPRRPRNRAESTERGGGLVAQRRPTRLPLLFLDEANFPPVDIVSSNLCNVPHP